MIVQALWQMWLFLPSAQKYYSSVTISPVLGKKAGSAVALEAVFSMLYEASKFSLIFFINKMEL